MIWSTFLKKHSRFKHIVFILILWIYTAGCLTLHGQKKSLSYHHYQADVAYYRHQIDEAIGQLQRALRISPKDGVSCHKLANFYAYYRRDYDTALDYARRALHLDKDNPENHLLLGQIYQEQKDFTAAIAHFQQAILLKPPFSYEYTFHLARAQAEARQIDAAIETLEAAVIAREPYYYPANRLLHELLVQTGAYRHALQIWQLDQMQLDPAMAPAFLADQYEALSSAIRAVELDPENVSVYLQLADVYTRLMLFREARLVLEKAIQQDPRALKVRQQWSRLQLYIQFMDNMKAIADAHYFRIVNGKGNDHLFQREVWDVLVQAARLFPDLGQPPYRFDELYFQRFTTKIRAEYKGVLMLGFTDGVYDCHFGHIVADETRQVKLWGREAKVRAIYLDYMVSNGFGSWAWQYQTQHGGISSPEDIYTVYQVRPPYSLRAVRDWWIMADPISRQRVEQEAHEIEIATSKMPADIFYSRQLQNTLRFKELEIWNVETKRQFADETERHFEFVKQLSQKLTVAGVFQHEGQHAIDRIFTDLTAAPLLEMRAKLSEIYHSEFPFLTLSELMTPDIGAKTAHGQANRQVFTELVRRIAANPRQYPEINADKSIIQQLPKLDADELRKLAHDMMSSGAMQDWRAFGLNSPRTDQTD